MRENKEDSKTREVQTTHRRKSSQANEAKLNIIVQHNRPEKIHGTAVIFFY